MRWSTVDLKRVVECASPPEALWPILADTDRFNRAVGLSRIAVQPLEGAGAARYLGATTLGGFRVEYEERPAEFVENERFKFLRVLRRGPVRSIETQFELRPLGAGTEVTLSLRILPRSVLFAPRAGASPARRGADRARAQRSRRRRLSHPSLRAGRFLAGAAPGGAGGLPAGGRRGAARAVLGPGLPELPDGRGPDCFPGGPAGRQPLPAVRSLLRPRAGQDRRGDLPAASAGARRRRRTLLHQRTGAHSSRGRAGAAARGIRGQAARAAPGGPAAALRPRRSHGERGGARRRPPGGPRQRRAEKSRRPRWSSGRAESSRCAARFLRSRT